MFSFYELGFRCFELNLFSHCFDSVRFEKFKPEQALRTLDWKDSLFTRNSFDLTKCLKFSCLRFQIRQLQPQGAHTSSVSVYGRNIKKCMGEYIEESYIVNLYRGMSKLKLKINVNLPQLLCIVVSVALDGEFERFGGFCVDCYYTL